MTRKFDHGNSPILTTRSRSPCMYVNIDNKNKIYLYKTKKKQTRSVRANRQVNKNKIIKNGFILTTIDCEKYIFAFSRKVARTRNPTVSKLLSNVPVIRARTHKANKGIKYINIPYKPIFIYIYSKSKHRKTCLIKLIFTRKMVRY